MGDHFSRSSRVTPFERKMRPASPSFSAAIESRRCSVKLVFVLHLLCYFLSVLKDRVRTRAEVLLSARNLWEFLDRRGQFGRDRRRIAPILPKIGLTTPSFCSSIAASKCSGSTC